MTSTERAYLVAAENLVKDHSEKIYGFTTEVGIMHSALKHAVKASSHRQDLQFQALDEKVWRQGEQLDGLCEQAERIESMLKKLLTNGSGGHD